MKQVTVVFALAALAAGYQDAAAQNACASISDAAARLACYDRANQPAQKPAADWPKFAPPRAGSAASMPSPRQKLPGRFSATVTHVEKGPDGHFVVTLENGQVWRQAATDTGDAHFRSHGDNTVTISRGFWRSFNLTINDQNAIFKVEQVK